MTNQKDSFFKELIKRRVPQIIGLYIAATWMMIEIGDWMVGRFHLAPEITSYIFIGMAVFLPSVVYLAFQYGHPGPDPWKKPTFIIVPTNLLLAVFATFYFVNPVIATETKTVTDENGQFKTFEVPKDEYRKNLVGFFWKNKSGKQELDWLQYGLPWLLSKDLDRSLFLSSYTPLTSLNVIKNFKKSGFKDGLKVPKPLQLKIARQRFNDYSLNGEFDFKQQQFILTLELTEVVSGKNLAKLEVAGNNFLSLIDELTIGIKDILEIPKTLEDTTTDSPVAEHISESQAAIQKLVLALYKGYFEYDYAGAKQLLDAAVEEDFSFAQAYISLARVNQLMGNSQEANRAIDKALQHEYKLTVEDQFLVKGMAYGLRGDYQSQAKVYAMWTEIDESNIEAHESLARILTATGLDLAKALDSLMKLRELNPHDDSVLLDIAQVFVLSQRLDKAIETLNIYIDKNPADTEALNKIAEVYERDSQFELARSTYQKVLLLDRDNMVTAINNVNLEIRLGNFSLAEEMLSQLMLKASTPDEKIQVYRGYLTLYHLRGQVSKVLEVIDMMADSAAHLPPLLQIFQIKFQKSFFLANIGKYQEAEIILDEVKAQLQPPLNGIIDAGMAHVYILQQDQNKIQELLDRLSIYLKQYPNPLFDSVLDNSKAQLREIRGEYVEAIVLYKSALKSLESSLVNTQQRDSILQQRAQLARAQNFAGDTASAEQELLAVIQKHPSMAIAFTILGDVYINQNKLDKAEEVLSKVALLWQNADRDYIEFKRYLEVKQKFDALKTK